MGKREFLNRLERRLQAIAKVEKEEVIRYYDELIQDAVDNGENEAEFVMRLGSIDEIIDTIRKDEDFLKKLREKHDFTLKTAVTTTTKMIGYFVFGILSFVVAVTSFSFIVSGGTTAVYGVIMLIVSDELNTYLLLMRVGNIFVGVGLVMLAVGLFQWYFRVSKKWLNQLFLLVQKWVGKGDKKNESNL